MNSLHSLSAKVSEKIRDIGLLTLRIGVAQEFLFAGYTKLSGGLTAPEWFSGLQFPFPLHILGPNLNWVAAGIGEVVLGLALLLGLFGRFAALGLLYITFVAVYTVHFDLGWAGWNQIETDAGLGFKVPLLLGLMLFVIVTQGSGKYSLDQCLCCGKRQAQKP